MNFTNGFPGEKSGQWSPHFFGHPDYLDLYQEMTGPGRTRDELRFCDIALNWNPGQSVLDAPCGAGRHSAPLARKGLLLTSLDLSGFLLTRAKKREAWRLWRRDRVPRWVQGNLLRLPLQANSFDYAISLFSSFGYMDSEDENQGVIREYARVLKPGGKLLVDVMNRNFLVPLLSRSYHSIQQGLLVDESRKIIDNGRRLHNKIVVTDKKGKQRKYLYRPWLYNGFELSFHMTEAGLETEQIYGAFDGRNYASDSERAMIVAVKP